MIVPERHEESTLTRMSVATPESAPNREPVPNRGPAPSPQNALMDLPGALDAIAARADARDAAVVPAFPHDAVDLLKRCGALAWNASAGPNRPPAGEELDLVRAVARADSSVGRIFDGHLNAVERLAVQAPPEVAERELEAVRAGRLLAGVWGGDPTLAEGTPALVTDGGNGLILRGVKTFCSGAGGLHRALVLARQPGLGPPGTVWVDLTDGRVEVDESWYRAQGLRASVSHRVIFHDVPVLASFGGPGAIAQQPWFSRDALRTAASWAGMADSAAAAALDELAEQPARSPLEGLAAGRILTAQHAIGLWLQAAARAMDAADPTLPVLGIQARVGIAEACRTLLDEAARACGSRPFARGGALERTRRDLQLFLLQHRLDPLLSRIGEAALASR
ncbi:MAG: acyl-CoA dehydrogenase family protein [Solirubrobacteraceae bacterium]